jgi:hypothetical protein
MTIAATIAPSDLLAIRALRAEIWELSQQDQRRITMARKHVGNAEDLYTYSRIRDWLVANPVKAKWNKAKLHVATDHRARYTTAYHEWQRREHPVWVKDGHMMDPRWPDTSTANGLTSFICNYLTWMGHRSTRINTQGQFVNEKHEGRIVSSGFRKSSTRKGTADISATVNGRSVMIEVKIKDKPSPAQLEEQAKERAAGGVYEFIHNIAEFFTLYDSLHAGNR